MILGINCVRSSITSDPGAGISALAIASAAPSSNSREMRVLKALRRKPITIRFMTRKITVPRLIVLSITGSIGKIIRGQGVGRRTLGHSRMNKIFFLSRATSNGRIVGVVESALRRYCFRATSLNVGLGLSQWSDLHKE